MEKVTENYLEGEQHICDVWTHHINSSKMTLEDSTEFVRDSHVHAKVSAHLILIDDLSMSGLSTKPGSDGDYTVSYKDMVSVFNDLGLIGKLGEKINITRAYSNPQNGIQSIAFFNKILLVDSSDGSERTGLLLRVVPVSELEQKWVYPQETYNNVEFSMIDSDGGFLIKGTANDITNFYDFFDEYNSKSQIDIRAENGKICADRLAGSPEGSFDLVFMDIQMPVMNGLEATKVIRRLDNWAKDIPIIAMTADAFSENVTECLSAGMNGHIAKPIDIKLVLKELRKIKENRA
ncbi:MAG: response regulator [Sphaerochaetaceae bacterium]|nr:response regulator [Sphaerochaetaceae bacterium]